MSFKWTPGVGPNESILALMREAAPKPDAAMGEAWFMGETRKMFTELYDDFESTSTQYLQEVLRDISGVAHAFGLHQEWEDWFRYLLPRIVPRCDERFVHWLFENLCSAFLQIELATNNRGYGEYDRNAILQTLGQVIMTESRWKDGRIVVGNILHPSNKNPAKWWGWPNVSGDLAAALIVCLRLVDDRDLDGWVESIFAIDCPYWHAQLLTWHVGARVLLNEELQFPSQFKMWTANDDNRNPSICWEDSHVVGSRQGETIVAEALIPDGRIAKFKNSFEAHLAETDIGQWKDEILEVPALRIEVGRLIKEFAVF